MLHFLGDRIIALIEYLKEVDFAVFAVINGLARQSFTIDRLFLLVSSNYELKGLFIMMLFWILWFIKNRCKPHAREGLLAVIIVTGAAIFTGRALAHLLPFRFRPLHTPDLDYNLPYRMSPAEFGGMSSFPSDHAVMFFALAVGLFHVNRTYGTIALVHAIIIISLPRVYLGIHFPGDIIAGALVGISLSLLLIPSLTQFFVKQNVSRIISDRPHFVYPIIFFITFQIATMFDSVRNAGDELISIALVIFTNI